MQSMPIEHVNALPLGARFEEYRLDVVLGAGRFMIAVKQHRHPNSPYLVLLTLSA